ncbi:3-phosphoshikimate 1-carboxyvinyltransferase 2 [Populus alba x Populus x berolinensis]|nr:3-phosphoshikimate 1-carboxyvinyltransferase 2 [Populus alba x Populus x berolinensis]
MTLAVVALFADGPTAIRDGMYGATVEEGPDYCVITPPEKLNVTEIDHLPMITGWHMASSLAACGEVQVTIKDPGLHSINFPRLL